MSAARVDSWLWAVRLVKTRSAATALCKAGHVRVNGDRAKPAQHVAAGDEIRFSVEGGSPRIVIVRDPGLVKRVSAPLAQAAYEDQSPPPPPPEERYFTGVRDRGAGRPTKRDRRDIERWLSGGGG
ncbi:RNA-binding S4 domain-containing protein [Pseudolysinimonas sp.]|uniref:RNA-binding S4 domain-containing protein n=1 Tax=Pseudolysinimonas sp. TaxID=2680009 RepID=UPI003F7F0654